MTIQTIKVSYELRIYRKIRYFITMVYMLREGLMELKNFKFLILPKKRVEVKIITLIDFDKARNIRLPQR